jgi:hypothetical protein
MLGKKNLRVARSKSNEAQKHGIQCPTTTLPYLEIRIPYLEMRGRIHFIPMHSFANTSAQYASTYHDAMMRCDSIAQARHANRSHFVPFLTNAMQVLRKCLIINKTNFAQ